MLVFIFSLNLFLKCFLKGRLPVFSLTCLASITEKAMAPHSSTFAQKIPWTEEPGRLQSMGSLESDTTERLRFHFSLSCIGEGNGNPLQCSCLRIPGTGSLVCCHLWVAQSRTRLKQLSSSSSSLNKTGLLSVCAEGSIYPKCLSTLAGGQRNGYWSCEISEHFSL